MIEISTTDFPQIAYRKIGKGPVAILLHGFPEDGALWRNICEQLSLKFTLIIPDIPGSGKSSFHGEEISIDKLAAAVKAVTINEQLHKIVLVGHSMGGYIALSFAALYPDMVAGLSLVHSTGFADTEEKKDNRQKAIGVIAKGGKDAFVKQMVPNLFSDSFRHQYPEVINEQIGSGLEQEASSMISYYKAMANRKDKTDLLKNAKFPIQWIAGRQDSVIPYATILKQTHLSSVNFVSLYDNCGHMSMFEKTMDLTNDLSAFFEHCYSDKNTGM